MDDRSFNAAVWMSDDRSMIAHCKDREAFGGPLTQLQNTRFKLAEYKARATVARTVPDQGITKHLRGELSVEKTAMSEYWLTDTQCDVLDDCVQLHDGYGSCKNTRSHKCGLTRGCNASTVAQMK